MDAVLRNLVRFFLAASTSTRKTANKQISSTEMHEVEKKLACAILQDLFAYFMFQVFDKFALALPFGSSYGRKTAPEKTISSGLIYILRRIFIRRQRFLSDISGWVLFVA